MADADVRAVTLTDADGIAHLSALARLAAGDRRGRALSRRQRLHRALRADAGRVLLPRPRPRATSPRTSSTRIERAHARASSRPTSQSRKTKVHARAGDARIFEERGETDKARLLAHRSRTALVLYELCGRRDYFQGYMLPSTGCLGAFALHPHPPGFVLQYPHQASPSELTPFEPYPRLFATFTEAGEWLDKLDIRGTGALNDAIVRRPAAGSVAGRRGAARSAHRAASRPTSSPRRRTFASC